MPGTAPAFLSLEGVVAIAAVLIFLGRALDWVLLKSHQAAILRWARETGEYLETADVTRTQKALITALINVIHTVAVPWTTQRLQVVANKPTDEYDGSDVIALMMAMSLLPVMTLISLIIVLLYMVGVLDSWFWAMMTIPCIAVMLRCFVWLARLFGLALEEESKRPVRWVRWSVESKAVNWFMGLGTRASLLSILLTSLALAFGMATARTEASSFWFTKGPAGLEPAHPILLALVNMPFDLLSLYTSVFLLTYGLRRGLPITLVAVIDIASTAMLVIVLHMTMLTIASGSLAGIDEAFRHAVRSFVEVVTLRASVAEPDWPTYPVLYTTFFPIGVYLLVPVIVGLVVRPAFQIAGYFCRLFGEKDKTPFFEIAAGMSLLVATIKALTEWKWFVHMIS